MHFLISFAITVALLPLLIRVAWRLGWVAQPRSDRWHRQPTALMGGIPMVLGTVAAWTAEAPSEPGSQLWLPATALFLLGVIDDRVFELHPRHKLIAQVAVAVSWLSVTGLPEGVSPAVAVPLVVLWLVGVTNAINLLDNMDGLAAGVSAVAAAALAAYCFAAGAPGTGTAALGLAGACVGFLLFNFRPARVFMGDCGSMFLGFSLAALSLEALRPALPSQPAVLALPVVLLGVPLFDTGLVVVVRALNRRPVLPGYPDHTSHRLVALGLSELQAVLVHYCFALTLAAVVLLAPHFPLPALALLGTAAGAAAVLARRLAALRMYPMPDPVLAAIGGARKASQPGIPARHVPYDLLACLIAVFAAHALRFEGAIPLTFQWELWRVAPVLVLAKLTSMAFAEAYRPAPRPDAIHAALTAVLGSLGGSLLAAPLIAGLYGFHNLSRAALLIDFMLFTGLVVTFRSGHLLLGHVRRALTPAHGPRVLVLGAGAEAFLLCSRLGQAAARPGAEVLGVLVDDPEPIAGDVAGVPIIGGLHYLPEVVKAMRVDHCLLGVYPGSPEGTKIIALCRSHAIPLYTDLESPALTAERAAFAGA